MLKLGLGGNGKYGEKNLNPGDILKVEFTGFVDLQVYELWVVKVKIKVDSKSFGLNNW